MQASFRVLGSAFDYEQGTPVRGQEALHDSQGLEVRVRGLILRFEGMGFRVYVDRCGFVVGIQGLVEPCTEPGASSLHVRVG